jgi:multidrug efflux system outer membrane protein
VERYKAGAVNFLEVVDAEAARLLNELARIRIANEQLIATVRLVKALGGGWQED